MKEKLRVVVVDDERPARSVLLSMLSKFDDVVVVGEASGGAEAVELIESELPDLALLDLHMPELDGLGVIRLLKRASLPMIAFVTAYDEFAVPAFDLNAIDYLLKPVDSERLRETISRAIDRFDHAEAREVLAKNLAATAKAYDSATGNRITRVPVRKRKGEIVIVPVEQITSIVADGELLHLTTACGEKHTITYRLKDLEARLDPSQFIRLSRGTIANIGMIVKVAPIPGGTYLLSLSNGEQLHTSRFQSRVVRERLLKL
jgi:two-component system LytT family response regulator